MTSLQDLGRFGFQRFGVSPAGAMDPEALTRANILVGNPAGTAAIEFCMLGGTFLVESTSLQIGFAGGGATLSVAGRNVPALTGAIAEIGETVAVGPMSDGVYGYLAIAGGFDVRPELGSLSVHRRAGLGGRPLQRGDVIPVHGLERGKPIMRLPQVDPGPPTPIRIILGPQDEFFTPEAIANLLSAPFSISGQADRMGIRLTGPLLEHTKGFNVVSDGIVTGHIQVPGDGQPIVLMRDRQTTGGYPKIATIISADLSRFSQMRPGTEVLFSAVSREEAIILWRTAQDRLAELVQHLAPVDVRLSSAHLLGTNLISGVISGDLE